MDAAPDSGSLQPLPYERWAVRFEALAMAEVLAYPDDLHDEHGAAGSLLERAEGLLLYELTGAVLFEGALDPVENPPVPVAVAGVRAEQEAATSLIRRLFGALFDEEPQLAVYTADGGYDTDGMADMLAPFAVLVLCGTPEKPRVLYRGEWLLEHLTAVDPSALRELHARLVSAVENYGTHRRR